ncbi:trypsin-like serine protease [Vibrio sp. 10N.261.46.A3]|uniref:trypsin-like serine protease n=1 Tax=Vibrio sp. 10N.261.46.A3 TaxID=3229658 RepID=UPI00354F642A
MKKTLLALWLSALSSSSFAITNGTVVDWQSDFDDYVSGNCTGLIIGGDQILTAAHCGIPDNVVVTHDGSYLDVVSKVDNPNYSFTTDYDVSILNIGTQPNQNIRFFSDLNNPTASVGDAVHTYGFAGSLTELKRGDFSVMRVSDASHYRMYHEYAAGISQTENGDSGSAWFNASDEIIGVTSGGDAFADLFYSKDFILETVDGWHYPTVLKGTGTQTVKVQSLHQNGVTDSAYATGDVQLVGGTCQTLATINEFDTCTYELDVIGTGQLHLSSDEVIDITPESGGSLSVWGLSLIALLGLRRRKAIA